MSGNLWALFLGRHRIIAVHTPLVEWTGSVEAAMLLEELVYRWQEADEEPFALSDKDLSERLYLSEYGLGQARKRLTDLGALEVIRRGMPRRLYYTMDLDEIELGIKAQVSRNRGTSDAKPRHKWHETEAPSISPSVTANRTDKRMAPAKPRPSNGSTPGRWTPVEEALSAAYGGIPLRKRDGQLQANAGRAIASLGRHNDNDPDAAVDDLARFRGCPGWPYVSLAAFEAKHGQWVVMGRPMSTAQSMPRGATRNTDGGLVLDYGGNR